MSTAVHSGFDELEAMMPTGWAWDYARRPRERWRAVHLESGVVLTSGTVKTLLRLVRLHERYLCGMRAQRRADRAISDLYARSAR